MHGGSFFGRASAFSKAAPGVTPPLQTLKERPGAVCEVHGGSDDAT